MYKRNFKKKAFLNHHRNLKNSTKLSYTKGFLNSYSSLMWYHGHLNKESYGLDNTMYYCNLFESKLLKLNTDDYGYIISNYYMDKGSILGEIFELTEESLSNFLKGHPFIPKEDKETVSLYDI